MNWRPFISLLSFMLIALIVGLLGWFTQPLETKWVVAAASLAILAVGLGINSFLITLNTAKRINEINTNITRIEELQIEMQKKQDEQQGSGSMIIPTLETFSKFYLDYLNKQKGEEEEQDNTGDTENQKE